MKQLQKLAIKYIFWLAGIYMFVRLTVALLLVFFPDILTVQYAENSYRTFSQNIILKPLEILCNIVLLFVLYRDMKKTGCTSALVLAITIFSSISGIVLFFAYSFSSIQSNKYISYASSTSKNN